MDWTAELDNRQGFGGESGVAEDCVNASEDRIPVEELSPECMSPEERFDAFCDLTAEVYDLSIDIPELRRQGDFFLRFWLLDNLVFADGRHGPLAVRRSPQQISRTDADHVLLSVGPGNPSHLISGDTVHMVDGLAFHLLDLSREHTEVCQNEDYCLVYLPHDAIGYNPARHPPYLRAGFDTPQGRILGSLFESLHGQLDDVRRADAAGLAEAFCGVVRGSFLTGAGDDRAMRQVQAARRQAMRNFIEGRLKDPDLGLAHVARSFGVGRATLFRDFAEDGGLERYIYRRRLERAYVDLASGPARRGRVAEVAETWCFASTSHFCQRFRTRFGCAPGEVVSTSSQEDDGASVAVRHTQLNGFGNVSAWINGR